MSPDLLQWVGYIASSIILISMTMNSIVKFRWINLVGASSFCTYGFLIHAIPVCILNGMIVLIDIYYLYNIYSKKEVFEILEIQPESIYLKRFLEFHNNEIQKICPGFVYKPDMNTMSFYILRNMAIAGIFLGHREQNNVLIVGLDYVIPQYRDFKNGKYVYNSLRQKFIDDGFTTIKADKTYLKNDDYFKKLGFKQNNEGEYFIHL